MFILFKTFGTLALLTISFVFLFISITEIDKSPKTNNTIEGSTLENIPIANTVQNEKVQNENSVIDQFIVRQEKKYKAVENKDARKVIWSDMNKDGEKDAIVLYTLESPGGSTLYTDYLAIFLKSQDEQLKYITHKIIGGKNRRAILEVESVTTGKIQLNTLEYSPNDARCCPSKKGYIQIVLIKNKLREVH